MRSCANTAGPQGGKVSVVVRGVLCTVLAFTSGVPARGELLVRPVLSPSVYVDDNRRQRSNDGSGVVASVTEVSFNTQYTRPTYSADITPRFRLIRNSSQKELDAEDYFVDGTLQKNLKQHQFAVSFGFAHEKSATTELEELGQIDAAVPKEQWSVSPSWTFFATERVRATLFGALNDVSYEQGVGGSLTDYRYSATGVNFEIDVSERTKILGRTSASLFETPALNSETTGYSFQVGFEHVFDDTLKTEVLVGQSLGHSRVYLDQNVLVSINPVAFRTVRQTLEGRGGGHLVSVRVDKEFMNDKLKIEWNRTISPSSLGSRQKREDVTTRLIHDFDDYWSAQLRSGYANQEQEALAGAGQNPLRRYSAGAALQYRLTQMMTVSLDYRAIYQERVASGDTSLSNRVTLAFSYSADPVSVSP